MKSGTFALTVRVARLALSGTVPDFTALHPGYRVPLLGLGDHRFHAH